MPVSELYSHKVDLLGFERSVVIVRLNSADLVDFFDTLDKLAESSILTVKVR